MSTSKIATALGAAVLLLGAPASYALVGNEKPDKVKQCSDGVDNDGDGLQDFAEDGNGDPDCGSPNDNDEATEESAEEPGGGAPGAPAVPPEVQALLDEVLGLLAPQEEEPCDPATETCEEPPAEEPAPDPATEVQALIDAVLENLPSGPPSGPPALPVTPPTPAEVEAAVNDVISQLPPPPAG